MTPAPDPPVAPDPAPAAPALSALYRDARTAVFGLVADLAPGAAEAPVPACPEWRVRDVVAHLAAVAEDALAGRLTGPPADDVTAAQVARFDGVAVEEMLARWEGNAAAFEEVIDRFQVWPAVIDAAAHEQDLRAALGRPGRRDSDVVRHVAEALIDALAPPVALTVVVDGRERRLGPAGSGPSLTTDSWEVLRWRLGRRSPAQLAAMAWSGDPGPVLDHLAVFGPAGHDVVE